MQVHLVLAALSKDYADVPHSHVFCSECSDSLGLSAAIDCNRKCPACQTILANPDDAVSTKLNPTEDYKTSVLSGLTPSTIMECAGRGLAFWTYQSTQEMCVFTDLVFQLVLIFFSVYQEYLAKTLTDKYSNLNVQVDKIINDANTELEILNQRLAGGCNDLTQTMLILVQGCSLSKTSSRWRTQIW